MSPPAKSAPIPINNNNSKATTSAAPCKSEGEENWSFSRLIEGIFGDSLPLQGSKDGQEERARQNVQASADRWKRSRSVPSTPRPRARHSSQKHTQPQHQQQQQQGSNQSTPGQHRRQLTMPSVRGKTRGNHSVIMHSSPTANPAHPKVARARSSTMESRPSPGSFKRRQQPLSSASSTSNASSIERKDSVESNIAATASNKLNNLLRYTPSRKRKELLLRQEAQSRSQEDQATQQHQLHEPDKRPTPLSQIHMGRSNANFRASAAAIVAVQNMAANAASGASSGQKRGPIIKAPQSTADSSSQLGSQAFINGHPNVARGRSTPLLSEKRRNNSSSSGADSSGGSLDGTLGPQRDDLSTSYLSPFASPCPSPGGGRRSAASEEPNHGGSHCGSHRLSPFTSPSTSPFLRRKRAEQRASSTGSAVAIPGSSKQLLSPYSCSVSPTPAGSSFPTTPTAPGQASGSAGHAGSSLLISRRLSSCRPSLSSCSSSLFSFSSSKEASPSENANSGQTNNANSSSFPMSPKWNNGAGGGPNKGGGGTPSNVFVYPSSPISRGPRNRDDFYGSLNPELYRDKSFEYAEDGSGPTNAQSSVSHSLSGSDLTLQLRFDLKYLESKDWLEVKLQKLKGQLPARDISELQIKLVLLPDEKRAVHATIELPESAAAQSEIVLSKQFGFPVAKCDLSVKVLRVNLSGLRSAGSGRRVPVTLGELNKPFRLINWEASGELHFCDPVLLSPGQLCSTSPGAYSCNSASAFPFTTETQQTSASSGHDGGSQTRVHLSLCYNPTLERLTVAVYECQGIKALCPQISKCYARLMLHYTLLSKATSKTKKTDVVKCNSSDTDTISFDQSFNFKLESESAKESGITVQIMEATNLLDKDRLVGQVTLGGPMLAKGTGLDHWVRTMSTVKESCLQWHNLAAKE